MFKFKLHDFLSRYFAAIVIVTALTIVIVTTVLFGFRAALIVTLTIVGMLVLEHIIHVAIELKKEKKRKNTCRTISSIADPGERLCALDNYIKNTFSMDQAQNSLQHDVAPMDKSLMQLKAALIFCLVNTCIEKGDYETAIHFCEEVLTMYPICDDIYSDEEITYKDQCILLISSCMMYQRDYEKTSAMLKSLKNKGFRTSAAKYRIDTHLMALAINTGDTQEARRLLALVTPEAIRADKTSPEYGILYELKLNEAMIDMLENKHRDAKEKLDDILENCISGVVRERARQLCDKAFLKVSHDCSERRDQPDLAS